MNKNLSGKTRFILLLAGSVLALWLVFKLGIGKTIALVEECAKIENGLLLAGFSPDKVSAVEKEIVQIETLYGSDLEDVSKLQERILDHLSLSCKKNKLTLIEMPKVHEFKSNDYLVKTFKIVVEGDFIGILRFVHELEFKPMIGRIASLGFYLQVNTINNRKKLYAHIFLQNIEL